MAGDACIKHSTRHMWPPQINCFTEQAAHTGFACHLQVSGHASTGGLPTCDSTMFWCSTCSHNYICVYFQYMYVTTYLFCHCLVLLSVFCLQYHAHSKFASFCEGFLFSWQTFQQHWPCRLQGAGYIRHAVVTLHVCVY